MKTLLVSWGLLLFGVSLNSGHYIRQAEAEDAHSVYQVKDDSSGVSFVNPKVDKRTLREILYYHIIERPREEPAVTERSFTNSHGYQFFDLASLLEDPYDTHEDEDDGSYVEQTDGEDDQAGDSENEEEQELTTTQKPLTDEDVKEAYKARSYLFDQARQRYAVKRMAVPEPSLSRRKRQAEMESVSDAPSSTSDVDSKAAYMQPETYGMNLNGDGGYVWNNLNNPPTYYELGSSNGDPNEGSSGPQSQENTPPSSENAYIPPAMPNESESSEDIYIVTNRPIAQPLETIPETNPEPSNESLEPINNNPGVINENLGQINDNPEAINDNPGPINDNPEILNDNPAPINENPEPSDSVAKYPVEPIIGDENSNLKPENEGFTNRPEYENPELPLQPGTAGTSVPQPEGIEYPISGNPGGESSENPGYGYGQPGETKKGSTEESSEGYQIKAIPVAPTLPPLNYDGLPDYIRDAISSSEKPASYEQTDNPYINPQPKPEDKQVMQDQMEGIFATMPPVEDIPKTYGMNLTSDGGHVWNDMVNPPVSYDVGSSSRSEEEHKEQPPAPVSEQPEPTEPEKEEPSQESETHESEEDKPVEEPAEPEKKPEEPIANPSEENHEPPAPENDSKPIEEPAEPTGTVELEPENPEVPEPGKEQPENPAPVAEPENPELVPEPENPEPIPEPENPGPLPEPENPESVPETGNEPENPELVPEPVPEPGNEPENPGPLPEPENPESVPEPGNEPENPELVPEPENTESVPEPGNEPENPEPLPEPENPESVPEIENEPENPELVPEPGNEPENPEPLPEPENPESVPETESPEPVPEPGNEEPENPELVPEPGNEDTEQTGEEPAEESNEDNDEPDIMSELLKSEQFWKWLGEWTATYMELLEKHIRKIAIQEICNREKSGEQMCLLEDKPEDNYNDGVIIKDGKIIVDGKEIEITNTDNLDKDLKKHQNNKGDNDKKNKNENKIEASTIYGNSVGNEKVTNVFIFTADKADEVIDNLKPDGESEVDLVIDDRIKENENKEKSTEVVDPSESNLGNTESNTSEINKEEGDNEETNQGEVSKEEPNEDNINESNNSEPEELNNEEVIKESEGDNEELNKNDSNEGEANEESNKDAKEPKKEESTSDIEESKREDDSKLEPSESESN